MMYKNEGLYKNKAFYSFLSNYCYNEIYTIMGTSFTKVRLFLHSLLHYQHTFSTFVWHVMC